MIYTLTDLLVKISTFLLIPFYTKKIPQEELGEIYTLIALGGILSTIYSLSLKGAISRFYFEEKENLKNLYSTIVNMTIILGGIFNFLILINYSLLEKILKIQFFPKIIIIIIISYLNIFYTYIYALMIMEEKAKQISIISIIISIINIIINIFLVNFMINKILAFLLGLLIGSFFQFLIFVFCSKNYYNIFILNRTSLKKYLSYSLKILPFDLSSWILTFSDRFYLTEYIGFKATAIYSIGYKVGQGLEIFINGLNKAYIPYVYKIFHEKKKEATREHSKRITELIGVEIFLTCSCITFFKSFIFLLGKDYSESYSVVFIISFAIFFNGLRLLFQPILDYNEKLLNIKLIIWLLSSGINILLNILLIPKYSYLGAAIATLISYIFIFILITYISLKYYKIRYEYIKIIKLLVLNIIILVISLNLKYNFYFEIFIKILLQLVVVVFMNKILKKFFLINRKGVIRWKK